MLTCECSVEGGSVDIRLKITAGPDRGLVVTLRRGVTVIGREPGCDLCLADPQVSRRHARLICDNRGCRVEDLRSSNGTSVNGEPVQRRQLADGDSLALGDTQGVITFATDPQAPVTSPEFDCADTRTLTLDEPSLLTQWAETQDFDQMRRARRDLEALYRIGRIISSILDTARLLPRILDEILAEIPRVDRCAIHLIEDPSARLVCRAVRRRRGAGEDPVLSATMAEQVLRERKALLTYDALSDERFRAAESIQSRQIRSALCVPLRSQSNVVGVIYADTIDPAHPFTDEDLRLLTAVGLQAGAAVENARLYESLADEKAALTEAHRNLQQAQQQLIQSEKLAAVGRLAAGVVHDIKNPLTVILGYTGLMRSRLERNGQPDDGLLEVVNRIEQGVSYTADVIEHLLMFARPKPPSMQPLDLHELIGETVKFLRHEINQAKAGIELRLAESPILLQADASQIKQVLINILLNAIQATAAGKGRVTLRTQRHRDPESHAVIEIEDNGKGMTPEECAHVFEPFYTTKEPVAGRAGGSGLGLSVSYAIIQSHGGRIEVQSKPSEGTIVRLILPAGTLSGARRSTEA